VIHNHVGDRRLGSCSPGKGSKAPGDAQEWYIASLASLLYDLLLTSSTGKQWHEPKKAFRPSAGLTTYEKRQKERAAKLVMKAKEKELKDEKEQERQVCCVHNQPTRSVQV
jgi:hypothetical protein